METNPKKQKIIEALEQLDKNQLHVYDYQNLVFGSYDSFDLWKGVCDAGHFYQEVFRAVIAPEAYRDEVIKEAYRLNETMEMVTSEVDMAIKNEKNAWEAVKTALYLHDIAIALQNFSNQYYQNQVDQRSQFFIVLEQVSNVFIKRVQTIADAVQNSLYAEKYRTELESLLKEEYVSPIRIFCEEDEWVIQREWFRALNNPTLGKGLMARMEGVALRGDHFDVLEHPRRRSKKSRNSSSEKPS